MSTTLIKSKEIKDIKKVLKKYSKLEIAGNNIQGTIILKSYRKYDKISFYTPVREEVDIEFHGKILIRYRGSRNSIWVDSKCARNSNVVTNRIIRRSIFFDLKNYLKYFGVNLKSDSEICKVTWK